MNILVHEQYILVMDVVNRKLYSFLHDGSEFHPPIRIPGDIQQAINYYEPRFGVEDDAVVISGLDRQHNYIKYSFSSGNNYSRNQIFIQPNSDRFYFYRFVDYGGKALIHGIDGSAENGRGAVICWLISTQTPQTEPIKIFSRCCGSKEPPLGEIAWINDESFVFQEGKGKKSKLTVYSTTGKQIGQLQIPGYVGGQEEICSDGRYLYVLSHENAQCKVNHMLSIIDTR